VVVDRRCLWILGIVPLSIRPKVRIHDLANALDVHHLSHRLSAGRDRYHIVTRLDEIACSRAAESTTTTASATRRSANRRFSGAEIDVSRRAALATTATTSESAARGHPGPECAHPRCIAPCAHRVHAVAHGRHRRGIGSDQRAA
jgi:hypothetical protein